MKKQYPCKNCCKRQPGCHDFCEEYKSVKKYNHNLYNQLHSEDDIDNYTINTKMNWVKRSKNVDIFGRTR